MDLAASHKEGLVVDVKGGDAFFIAPDNRKTHGNAPFKMMISDGKRPGAGKQGRARVAAEENLPGVGSFAF